MARGSGRTRFDIGAVFCVFYLKHRTKFKGQPTHYHDAHSDLWNQKRNKDPKKEGSKEYDYSIAPKEYWGKTRRYMTMPKQEEKRIKNPNFLKDLKEALGPDHKEVDPPKNQAWLHLPSISSSERPVGENESEPKPDKLSDSDSRRKKNPNYDVWVIRMEEQGFKRVPPPKDTAFVDMSTDPDQNNRIVTASTFEISGPLESVRAACVEIGLSIGQNFFYLTHTHDLAGKYKPNGNRVTYKIRSELTLVDIQEKIDNLGLTEFIIELNQPDEPLWIKQFVGEWVSDEDLAKFEQLSDSIASGEKNIHDAHFEVWSNS